MGREEGTRDIDSMEVEVARILEGGVDLDIEAEVARLIDGGRQGNQAAAVPNERCGSKNEGVKIMSADLSRY